MLKTKKIEYYDGNTKLEGYYAFDDSTSGKKPAVLVVHDWSGRNDFACQKAEKLAELGYLGFAIDMYGKVTEDNNEKMALMKPFLDDRNKLRQRLNAALNTVRTLELVTTTKIAVIGFCFGGLCALDLARSGETIRGVVSFHGLLTPLPQKMHSSIHAKVLVLHGHDDPMVAPEQITQFQNEMTKANADWQLHIFSNTKHAFTNPIANDPKLGLLYNPIADKRSWIEMKSFLSEIFS